MVTILLVISLILCVLAGCGVSSGRANLLAFGIAFLVASFLAPLVR